MQLALEAPALHTLAVAGRDERFPVNRVFCIDRSGRCRFVNDQPRQSSDIAKLIWSVSECVAYLSEYEALEPGDLIMTGTPEGVSAVVAGDLTRGEVQGLGAIEVRVTG
jgi:fumarylpyruvate hydrolase